MKVYCKKTFFEKNTNFYPINGKDYDKEYVKWALGKTYKCREPKEYEKFCTYLIIESEMENSWWPISYQNFKIYFTTLEEKRNNIIEKILK